MPKDREGKYVHPEDMRRLSKRNIRYLPCGCIFCSMYKERRVSNISFEAWQTLRREHWLWWLNDEIQKILDANTTGLSESLRQRFQRTIHNDWIRLI